MPRTNRRAVDPRAHAIDTSATPLARYRSLPGAAVASALMWAPVVWWQGHVGVPVRHALIGCAVFVLVSVVAQEPVQRAIGGGRLDNRLVVRLVLALGLFGALTAVGRMGFLFPVSAVLVAAVHVHWTGSSAWRPVALLTALGTVAEELLVHLGLTPSLLPDPASHLAAAFGCGLALLGVGNLGLAALRREEIAAELAATRLRFERLVQHSSDLVLVLEADGTIGYTSSAAESVVHHRPEQLVGQTVAELVHPEDRAAVLDQLGQVVGSTRPVHREVRAARPGQWLELRARSLLDDPVVAGVLVNIRDVTERRAFQERLAHAASHDDLTGLLARSELELRLGALVADARPGAGVALLYVDLDGFKAVNDRLGHAAGDAVLVAVAERLTALLRPEDLVVRMGGDEFVAVLPLVPDRHAAEVTVERIRDLLVQPVPLPGTEDAAVGVSIGMVFLDRPEADLDGLVILADAAMYREKRDRRREASLPPPRPSS